MVQRAMTVLALLVAGCANGAAERQARLQALIGKDELAVVRALGVPSTTYTVGNSKFLAFNRGRIETLPGTGGWGGWGGWGFGWAGGLPPEVVQYVCTTTIELDAGRVSRFTEQGNGCWLDL